MCIQTYLYIYIHIYIQTYNSINISVKEKGLVVSDGPGALRSGVALAHRAAAQWQACLQQRATCHRPLDTLSAHNHITNHLSSRSLAAHAAYNTFHKYNNSTNNKDGSEQN